MDEIPLPTPAPHQQSAVGLVNEIAANATFICPQCHFPVKPEYYFCPNCGKNLRIAPLPTDSVTQILIYGFSAVLPVIAYLAITKWPGIKYIRSADEKTRQIGYIALAILVISSVIMFWLTYVWIQGYIQQSLNDANNLGF